MERFAHKELVLLGYSPQRALENQSSSPKTPFNQPDIDFHDVFGGPPRRSSKPEIRYGFTETLNYTNNTPQGEDDTALPRSPWSGLNEMPVFGDEIMSRRRYPSDDFFDDIFRGDESLNFQGRPNHDPFASTPGSRVLSPARPLPPRTDAFNSSLPAQLQFSLPAKLTKSMEFPVSANGISGLYTQSPLSRLSSEASQEDDDLRNEIPPSHRPSPLSHELSLSCKESSGELESTHRGGNSKKDFKSTEAPINSRQFHFSIYKWASRGVPLLIPLRGRDSTKSKEMAKNERCSSSNGRVKSDDMANGLQTVNWCDSDLHSLNQSVSANDELPYIEGRKQDSECCFIVEEAVITMPGSKSIHKVANTVEIVPGDVTLSDKREEIEPHSLSETGFCETTEKGITMSIQKVQKPESMTMHSLLYDSDGGQDNDDITRKSEEKDTVKTTTVSDSNADLRKNLKKRAEKRINSKRENVIQVNEPNSQDSSRKPEDNLGRNRVKGKVKEFVKIFNQEAASKPKIDIETRSRSSRWKNTGSFGADNERSANTTQINLKSEVDQKLEEPEKQQSHLKTPVFDVSGNPSGLKDATASSLESYPDGSKVTDENIEEDLFEENFMIKELSNDQDKLPQTGDGYKDIQVSDAKIRQWSNGKADNIRSLLSTLQYVLWPGSGWKPVPLVDIIEGSAVKRAYQKALLCLHPDKLQQKGAAPHQKYIAEKVFDILQEAWDHFNLLGAI